MFTPYNFDEDVYQLLDYSYGGNIFPAPMVNYVDPGNGKYNTDPVQVYKYNSRKFRSKEFSKDTEIIFSGCSFTEGIGVPEEYIWGSQVASKLGMTYSNLGKAGTSVYYIVKNLFGYFKEYGHPKYLFCLFPDYTRYVGATAPYLYKDIPFDSQYPGYGIVNGISNFNSKGYQVAPKYIKRPYELNDVISNELAFMLNGIALTSLIQYCRAVGIKFVWSTWNTSFSDFVESEKSKTYDLEGYVSIENTEWHADPNDFISSYYHKGYDSSESNNRDFCKNLECKSLTMDCHSELYELFPDNFHHGTDTLGTTNSTHWGVHRHTHVAEIFLKALID